MQLHAQLLDLLIYTQYPLKKRKDGPKGGLDVLKKLKTSWPARNQTIPLPVTSHYTN